MARNALEELRRLHQPIADEFRDLRVIRKLAAPSDSEVVCVVPVFNERLRLPDTLRHNRQLGVDRFAVLDNGSTDGTLEYLLEQPDVDLYQTFLPFRNSIGGVGWVSTLIHQQYSPDRWVLWCDADEQLVYDGCAARGLHELCALLEARGQKSLPTVMIDMYSDTSIALTGLLPKQALLDRCPFFDGAGYRREEHGVEGILAAKSVRWGGGPMERVFRAPPGWLAKVSLMYWDADTYYWNPHVAYPFERNFGDITGALLHFKFLSDFQSNVAMAVQLNQHAYNSEKYRIFNHAIMRYGDFSLMYEQSRRYFGTQSFLDCGYMSPIQWPQR